MNGKEKLEREELEDIIKFSEGLAFMDSNYYSPFLSNELLQNLNTIKGVPSYDVIQKALVDFNSTPENLQMYNEFAAQFNMIFKRTLYSYVNSLALDLSYVCTNAYTKADYESAEYAKDKVADPYRRIIQTISIARSSLRMRGMKRHCGLKMS